MDVSKNRITCGPTSSGGIASALSPFFQSPRAAGPLGTAPGTQRATPCLAVIVHIPSIHAHCSIVVAATHDLFARRAKENRVLLRTAARSQQTDTPAHHNKEDVQTGPSLPRVRHIAAGNLARSPEPQDGSTAHEPQIARQRFADLSKRNR